uniref:Cilia- and flagella-associated protein 43 n=1 Tax=Timema poppense TaxID=170557 RepID=A0A7R9DH91_TIMPO|nr:unnamed protein product [Timema poppensis]
MSSSAAPGSTRGDYGCLLGLRRHSQAFCPAAVTSNVEDDDVSNTIACSRATLLPIPHRWIKFGKITDITFVGKETLAIINECHILLYDIGLKKNFIYYANCEEHGDGVQCLAGHRTMPMFAFAEKCYNPRILLFSYPDFTPISILKGACPDGYTNLVFSELEYIVSLSTFPQFIITVWCWRTGAKLAWKESGSSQPGQQLLRECQRDGTSLTSPAGRHPFMEKCTYLLILEAVCVYNRIMNVSSLKEIYIEVPNSTGVLELLSIWDDNRVCTAPEEIEDWDVADSPDKTKVNTGVTGSSIIYTNMASPANRTNDCLGSSRMTPFPVGVHLWETLVVAGQPMALQPYFLETNSPVDQVAYIKNKSSPKQMKRTPVQSPPSTCVTSIWMDLARYWSCSLSSPVVVSQMLEMSERLLLWEINVCSKRCMLSKNQVFLPEAKSCCGFIWAPEGVLHVVTRNGDVYTVDAETHKAHLAIAWSSYSTDNATQKPDDKTLIEEASQYSETRNEGEEDKQGVTKNKNINQSNVSPCIAWFKGGIVVAGPDSYIKREGLVLLGLVDLILIGTGITISGAWAEADEHS